MKLDLLPKIKTPTKKRLGRGLGSGKGKTGGRGSKGQKARGKVPASAVGAGLALYKKLPYVRGWSRSGGNPKRAPKPVLITLDQLNRLKAGSVVNIESLIEQKFVSNNEAKKKGIKILNKGELKVSLTVELPVSKSAQEAVEKAGGQVVR